MRAPRSILSRIGFNARGTASCHGLRARGLDASTLVVGGGGVLAAVGAGEVGLAGGGGVVVLIGVVLVGVAVPLATTLLFAGQLGSCRRNANVAAVAAPSVIRTTAPRQARENDPRAAGAVGARSVGA